MEKIQNIMTRAQSLRRETALNSITPERAGGIMYDTLAYLNQQVVWGANPMLISKLYASVSAMNEDANPISDLTGNALKPGQIVAIVPSDPTAADAGAVYRYLSAGEWEYVATIGDLPALYARFDAQDAEIDRRMDAQDAEIDSRMDAQDTEIAQFKEAVQDQVDNYPMVTINGNVSNAPDQEDITTDASNRLKFANRSALYGKGYVILRRDATLASQVTLQNTIYEIRYDFDLGGASFTMPTGCVLNFAGGSIKNGTLVLAETKLEGTPRFYGASLSGTTPTQNFKISWCESGIPQYIADVLSMDGTRVVFDKDVSLGNHSEISVTHIDIDGGGHSVRNMPSMVVGNADISIKDISITQADGNPDVVDFIRKSSESHTGKVNKIEFINVSFDGGNIARSFFVVPPTAAMEVSYVADIRGCHFFNIFHHGIYIGCDVSGIIAGNEFDHIGHERLGGDTANYTANALVIGNNTAFNDGETRLGIAHDIEVTCNYFHHIIGSYSNKNDVREIHSILAYGDNVTISYNRSEHLSTQLATIADTGMDAEAIYLKGRNSNIVGNVVIDGAGESSNAAITAKIPAGHHNRITDNVVINTTLAATGIMIGGKKIVVSGNTLQYNGSGSPYSIYMEGATEALISNNVFAAPNGSHKILIRGDAEIFGNLINDSNELTIGSTDAVLNFHDNSITFKVGTYLVRLRDSKYTFIGNRIRVASGTAFTRLINASSSSSCVIRNNSFEFDALTISRLFSGAGAWEVVGNIFAFTNCTISGNVAIIYLPGSGVCVKNTIVGTTDIQPSGAIITDIGTTTNRPSHVPAGFQYYDVTEKKFILWNGTAWVNMDGTSL